MLAWLRPIAFDLPPTVARPPSAHGSPEQHAMCKKCAYLLHQSHARVTRTLSPFRLRFLVPCGGSLGPVGIGKGRLSEVICGRLPLRRELWGGLLVWGLFVRMCVGRLERREGKIRSCPRFTRREE